ncbi:hypothetical protein C2G38_2055363, partial [Gigaspora rosea]
IPDCYIELANQCMDSDPKKRPTSVEIIDKLNKCQNKIKSQFLESNEINKKLAAIKENINNIYTSKAYNITEINKSLSKLKISIPVSTVDVPNF